ncbi:MAG: MAPEG family protein [Allosphingosinicella sp.]
MTPHLVLPITLTLTGAAVLANIWLGTRIARLRRAHRVSIGDGGIEPLTARMRAQANYIEHTPFFLILVGLIELATGPQLWLWIVGMAFILARIAHGLGMDGGRMKRLRAIGMITTVLILLGLSAYGIFLAYQGTAQPRGMTYAEAARAST